MWSKFLTILSIILFVTSCKKVEVDYDPEKELPKDTLTFISAYDYSVSALVPNQIDVQMSFTTFNQLQPQTDYLSVNFDIVDPSSLNTLYNYNLISSQNINQPTLTTYSTVLLFEKGSDNWYNNHKIGFYLRRFLERTNGNVALAYYEIDNGLTSPVIFSNNDGGSIYNNSVESNIEDFYDQTSTFSTSSISLSYVINKLDETITQFVSSTEYLPNQSITLFIHNSYSLMSGDSLLIENLIARALLESVEINVITDSEDNNFKKIAYKTNGVFIGRAFQNSTFFNTNKPITNVSLAIESLDDILKKNYSKHQINFTITDTTSTGFVSPQTLSFTMKYKGADVNYYIEI